VVKTCMYCGQPLARADARFCTECGRLQPLEPDPAEASGVIKVRLPLKEIVRQEPPAAQADPQPVPPPGPVRIRQGQPAQPVSQPPLRPARRPVRLTAQAAQIAQKRPEPLEEAVPPPADASPRPPADRLPEPVEELSTMILPGWREELEHIRQQQNAAEPPAAPPALISAVVVQQVRSQQPVLPPVERETQELPAEHTAVAVPQQDGEAATSIVQTDSVRRELHVRVWEQEPTRRYPHVQVEKPEEMETRPAPAVEHPPFTTAFEEGDESPAEQTAIDWQALAGTGAAPVLATEQAESLQEPEEHQVEDLPTVPLAVPPAVKRPSAITIERASTPAPAGPDASRQEIESQPTRPMPVSQTGAPVSLSPQRQPGPVREKEQRVPPSPSGSQAPAAARQNAASPLPPTRGVPPAVAREPVSNPRSLPGQSFTPSGPSLAHSPLSSPGNTMLQSLPAPVGQRPPTAPAPITPLPAPARQSRPRRVTPLRVALLVGLLVVLGAGALIIAYQATSGGAQAYQTFENETLGVFLTYPQGWAFHLNRAQTSVQFADSSQTGQVTLNRTVPGPLSLTQYLDQQVTQLGIVTPQFAPTRLFAEVSWQRVQGDVVRQGATYMLDLYVTRHGTYLYTLIFLAPPSAYERIEQESFGPLRASFRFIQGQ